MSAFNMMALTTKGATLFAKAQTGIELHFTRVVMGDGELGGASPIDLNTLVSPKVSLEITKLETLSGGKAVTGGVLNPSQVTTGFFWRELGIYAQDPDQGEILYYYGNAGANASYIPAGGGSTITEKHIDVITIIGNASNVTATIDQSLVYATIQDLQSYAKKTDLASTTAGKGAFTVGVKTISGLTATNVQEALEQTFQFANNGKADIATVVGSPVSSGDTFTQIKTKLQTIKDTMAANLTAKGITAVATETMVALAGKIASIIRGSGNAQPGDVLAPKTFTNDSGTVQTGTLTLTGNAQPADVLNTKTFYNTDAKNKVPGTMTNKVGSGTVITPSSSEQTIPQGYYGGAAGDGKVAAVIVPVANVLSGTTIAGQTGTMPNRGAPTFTPGTTDQSIPAGYYSGGAVKGDADLIESNIRQGIDIFGKVGSLVPLNGEKKWASGTTATNGSGQLIISGLNFKPSLIIAISTAATKDLNIYSEFLYSIHGNNFFITDTGGFNSYRNIQTNGTNEYVRYGEFKFTVLRVSTCNWIAIE